MQAGLEPQDELYRVMCDGASGFFAPSLDGLADQGYDVRHTSPLGLISLVRPVGNFERGRCAFLLHP